MNTLETKASVFNSKSQAAKVSVVLAAAPVKALNSNLSSRTKR